MGLWRSASNRGSVELSLWGSPTEIEVEKVVRLTNFGFYLPRVPRAHERAAVHVRIPVFDEDGKPDDSSTTFTILGEVEEGPDGSLVRVPMNEVCRSLKGIPGVTTSKFIWVVTTKPTVVNFTPFIEPDEE